MITKRTHCNTFYLLRCQRLISHRILFLDILHITNDHILIPVKGIIPPSDDIHIDILKNINLGNNPLLAPLIGIIGRMSVQIILKNIDPVRTNMITKESDKLLNLLVRIIMLHRRTHRLIDDQFTSYLCFHNNLVSFLPEIPLLSS